MTANYVESESEGFQVLSITGELNTHECANFRMATHSHSAESIVIDVSGLDYLDSSGLGCLLGFGRELKGQGKALVLVVNETVSNILGLTRLNGAFLTAWSVEEAVEILKNLR